MMTSTTTVETMISGGIPGILIGGASTLQEGAPTMLDPPLDTVN